MAQTILIVEDEKNFRDLLRGKLTEEGYQVIEAADGEQGLVVMKKMKIDFILLDLLMPGMDGITFYYNLQKLDSEKRLTPVMILTNLANTTYPHGVVDMIVKSNTSLKDIIERVKTHLSYGSEKPGP